MELLNRQTKSPRFLADQLLGTSHVVLLIPWLLFLAMGLSTARLVYQAWQEQALLDTLETELRREKLLQQQKKSFLRLSSHYLRTPLTLIASGIDLVASQESDKANLSGLKQSVNQLKLGVEALLATGNSQTKPPAYPSLKNANIYLLSSLVGAMVVVSTAVYLLANLDFSDLHTGSLIGEAAVLLMTGVLIFSARRSRSSRLLVRKQVEQLIVRQKELDSQRNELVRGSLQNLEQPLQELKNGLSTPKNNPAMRAIVEGVREFEDVLRQFTILASLETGTLRTFQQEVSLKEIITKTTEILRSHLESKQLHVRLDLKVDSITLDPLLLEFVFKSLIENAIEFSPEGKNIDVISRRDKKNIDLFVRDEGSGIAGEKLTSLFQPFFKTETGERFEHQGLGLSLYMDKLAINYLGGEVGAESQIGKGTVIKIRLPLEPKKASKTRSK